MKRSHELKQNHKHTCAKFTRTCARIVNENERKLVFFSKKHKRSERSANEVRVIPPLILCISIMLAGHIYYLNNMYRLVGAWK